MYIKLNFSQLYSQYISTTLARMSTNMQADINLWGVIASLKVAHPV